jgi:hypothetical protein
MNKLLVNKVDKVKRKVTSLATAFVVLLSIITLALPQLPMGLASEGVHAPEASRSTSRVDAQERSPEELNGLLQRDPDVGTLIAVRDEMTRRFIDRRVSTVALKRAYQAMDEEKVAALLGYSPAEILALNYRLDRARKAVFGKFPEIARLANEHLPTTSCGFSPSTESCGIDQFLNRLAFFDPRERVHRFFDPVSTNASNPPEGEFETEKDPDCDWGPYTAALALCTLAGPFWYWACAYVALCSFCRGGWVDDVCTRSE